MDFKSLFDVKKTERNTSVANNSEVEILYLREDCHDLLIETLKFEGHDITKKTKIIQSQWEQQLSSLEGKYIFIDLIDSKDLLSDIDIINSFVDPHKVVITIGCVDSIAVQRLLNQRGYHYLLWPIEKLELSFFIKNSLFIESNESSLFQRKAKRIAILGTKGGVGCSLFSAELSGVLARREHVHTLLVDHKHNSSDLDIVLLNSELSQKIITSSFSEITIDQVTAQSLTNKIHDYWHYLGITSAQLNDRTISDFNELIVNMLYSNYNFIVDDFSMSIDSNPDLSLIVKDFDIIIILLEPSLSSVRTAMKLKAELSSIQQLVVNTQHRKKLMMVVNSSREQRAYSLNLEQIEKYLNCHVDFNITYEKSIQDTLLTGVRMFESSSLFGRTMQAIANDIVGKPQNKSTRLNGFFWKK